MGVQCLVPNCCHYSDRDHFKYFRIPMDQLNLNRWKHYLNLTNSLIQAKKNPRVCSCHFKENKKPVQLDASHLQPENKRRRSLCDVDASASDNLSEAESVRNGEENETVNDCGPYEPSEAVNVGNVDENQTVNVVIVNALCEECKTENVQLNRIIVERQDEIDELTKDIQEYRAENVQLKRNIVERQDEINELTKNIKEYQAENIQLKNEIVKRQDENDALMNNNFTMEKRLMNISYRFSMTFIEHSDELIYLHTGLPNKGIFNAVFETINNVKFAYAHDWKVTAIPKRDQFLLTLMKLRLNLKHFDLAQRFECSMATVSNVFRTFVLIMHELLFQKLMGKIPSRQKNRQCLPKVFASFSMCRIVLDASEIMSDKPNNMFYQRLTFSPYKHFNTWKALFGVLPNGIITYVSDLYPGSTSDKQIVEHCGVTKQLIPGDLVIADKGFLIRDSLPYGVDLNLPPFLSTPQFTEAQVHETKKIARARVHVERAINKAKNFHILDHVSAENYSLINEIFQVCVMLTNFQNPLISEISNLL